MKKLSDILSFIETKKCLGNEDVVINSVQIDSRLVAKNDLFVCMKGGNTDGHNFIESVIAKGASVIVVENLPEKFNEQITYVVVDDTTKIAGVIANAFNDFPSKKLKIVGVTGTNGKTTVATLLYQLFTSLGYKCALLSTVENRINNKIITSTHTTPDVVQLSNLLKLATDEQCTHVFMEVSSHAIHQHRIAGVDFAGAIFTNITQDHLDYHKTFDNYIAAKKMFFDQLQSSAFALSNADEKRGNVMLQNTKAKKYFYGLRTMADFKGLILENSLLGLNIKVDGVETNFNMIGEFNAYNLLAVYATAVLLGIPKHECLQKLSSLKGAEGRFDYLVSPTEKLLAIVDYAHTPDALQNILETIKKINTGNSKIISVVGCGGDRDKTKRPLMGNVAATLSDRAIFTSDNPRSETPMDIIQDMQNDLPPSLKKKILVNEDRREAIRTAMLLAQKEDIILIAGKGHEKYQEVKGVKNHFDDKEEVVKMFQELNK